MMGVRVNSNLTVILESDVIDNFYGKYTGGRLGVLKIDSSNICFSIKYPRITSVMFSMDNNPSQIFHHGPTEFKPTHHPNPNLAISPTLSPSQPQINSPQVSLFLYLIFKMRFKVEFYRTNFHHPDRMFHL